MSKTLEHAYGLGSIGLFGLGFGTRAGMLDPNLDAFLSDEFVNYHFSSIFGWAAVIYSANTINKLHGGNDASFAGFLFALPFILFRELASDPNEYKGGVDAFDLFGGIVALALYVLFAKMSGVRR